MAGPLPSHRHTEHPEGTETMAHTRGSALEQLEIDISQSSSTDEAARYLIEHLADWGPEHFDVQTLAERELGIDEDDH